MGCLPVHAVLRGRGMPLNPRCLRCNLETETIHHALIFCRGIRTYFDSNIVDNNPTSSRSFVEIFFSFLKHLSKERVSTLGTIAWTTWKQRNAQVWTGHGLPNSTAMQQGLDFVREWQHAKRNLITSSPTQTVAPFYWSRPDHGWLKCNLDGAIFEDSCQVGVCGVIRNEVGAVVHAFSRVFPGCFTPVEVEALALHEALHRILRLQLSNTMRLLDALLVRLIPLNLGV